MIAHWQRPTHFLVALALTACGPADPPLADRTAPMVASPPISATPTEDRCRLATSASDSADCPGAADADHDGVGDGSDHCPDTTPGLEVDAAGCARASGE